MNSQWSLQEVLSITNGQTLSSHAAQFQGVGTDTREMLKDQLFIALKGATFDAHDLLDQAEKAGAKGLLVHHWNPQFDSLKAKLTIILVKDTLLALQQLGMFRRQQWNKPLVAITGSNGKTTTKEFAVQIISAYRQVHYNKGSYNNHWGLPLTLLGLQPVHELAICELGMNHSGEIATLVQLALPNVVGVTMVGRAHLEGLGSIEAVAKAKSEIYTTSTGTQKIGIFNIDDEWTQKMYHQFDRTSHRTLTFSAKDSSRDVFFQIEGMEFHQLKLKGMIQGNSGQVTVPVFGAQNVTNLMFAACVGLAVGLSPKEIWKALPLCKTTWGRNQLLHAPNSTEILFDAYNANPDSQKALLENLKILKINRPLIGIFGDMRELGFNSEFLHEELGELVRSVAFSHIYFIGNHGEAFSRGFHSKAPTSNSMPSLRLFSDVDMELISQLKEHHKSLITIKGSRGVRLERILTALQAESPQL